MGAACVWLFLPALTYAQQQFQLPDGWGYCGAGGTYGNQGSAQAAYQIDASAKAFPTCSNVLWSNGPICRLPEK